MNVLEGILWVLAGILGLLVALLFLPVGVQVRYDDSGFRISLLAGPIRWQLLPAKSGWLHRKWTRSKSEKAPKPAPKKVRRPGLPPRGEPGRDSGHIGRCCTTSCRGCGGAFWCGGWSFG